jgi:hypothetical protein
MGQPRLTASSRHGSLARGLEHAVVLAFDSAHDEPVVKAVQHIAEARRVSQLRAVYHVGAGPASLVNSFSAPGRASR